MLVGRYQHKPPLPFTIVSDLDELIDMIQGSEGSGVIIEVGSGVSNVTVGQVS